MFLLRLLVYFSKYLVGELSIFVGERHLTFAKFFSSISTTHRPSHF